MSWWDSKGLANFATKALKTAQQQIDKALDIKEDESGQSNEASFSDGFGGDDFWGSYLGSDASPATSKKAEQSSSKKQSVAPTEDDLFASLASPGQPSDSASELAQKAKSLQDKMKATSKKTFIEATSPSNFKQESEPIKSKADEPLLMKDENLSSAKKGAPLKLGMKLGSKKKENKEEEKRDESNPVVAVSQYEIEEKLKREKEAELKLLEMLGDESAACPKSPPAVATLQLKETEKELNVSSSEMGSFVEETASQNSSLFNMSGSSIMQDSHCEWGDDVSLSILAESTTSLSGATQADTAKTSSNTSQQLDDAEKSFAGGTSIPITGEAEEKHIIDESANTKQIYVDPPQESDTTEREQSVLVEKSSVVGQEDTCDEQLDIPVSKETDSCENIKDDICNQDIKLECEGEQFLDDSENDDLKQNVSICDITGEKIVTENALGEKSLSFVMDDSQTSSSVDDLSSSNRTLTTEDLQALDNSPEVSQELPQTSETKSEDSKTESPLDSGETATSTEILQGQSEPVAKDENKILPAQFEKQAEYIKSDTQLVHGDKTNSDNVPANDNTPHSTEVHPCSSKATSETHFSEQRQAMVSSQSSQLSSCSSFVKNMLEEAMVESVKDNDSTSHCDSTSHSSSDMVRIESGQNSEQTSADELETATSSDIEIISHISTPTPNGGNDRPYELSGLRYGFSKMSRRSSPPGHRRTDSDSSGFSMQSKNGDENQESRVEQRQTEQARKSEEAAAKQIEEDAKNNPYETEKLLKESKNATNLDTISEANTSDEITVDSNRLLEKLAEMAEVLEAREKKLVELSRSNMDLTETNSILRNQLQQSEEARETELTDLNQLTDEFTARISEAERKLNQATKERDALKKHSSEMESLLTKRSDASSSAQKMLLEKDQQISELMEEGEKLSKQQLQSNNIIKKLRGKEKENEALIKSQKEKLETQKTEMERLKKVLDNKCDVEKMQADSINQLQAAVQRYETGLEKLKSDLEESSDKNRSLQAALDNSYKEIAELHKANVMKASQVQEEKLSSEMQAKQELQIQLDRQLIQAKQEQEALLNQIEDLRLSMTRLEKEGARREDILRQEISDLQQRIQEAEDRNQELTQGVTAATRPLLRQIENLQSTYTAQSSSYERVEKNLTDRLNEAQISLATAQEKERVASEQLMEVTSKLIALETQLSSLKQDKSKLQAQLEMEKTKVEVLEDAKNNFAAQREALQTSFDQEISQLKKDKLLLENQCEMEKIRVEAEKKKAANIAEQLRDKEMQLTNMVTSRSSTPKDGLVRDESPLISSMASMSQSMSASFFSTGEDTMDRSFVLTPNSNKTSLYESLRATGAATLMESLQSQVKQQDGEIVHLQNEIRELERTRESMAREMVTLSNNNLEQSTKLEEFAELKKRYQDLDQRYNALLQMYGEKVEEVQELKLDLSDIKDLYKSQIDELLTKH